MEYNCCITFLVVAFAVALPCGSTSVSEQNGIQTSVLENPYPIAGPKPETMPRPDIPQTAIDTGSALGLSGSVGRQFGNAELTAFLCVVYSAFGPAFFWLSGTARTPLMTAWYTSFTTGFSSFGILLKVALDAELPALCISILPLVFGAVAVYLGYRFKYPCYCLSIVWSALIFVTLVHVMAGSALGHSYNGLGSNSWILYIATIAVFCVFLLAESLYFDAFQNAVCAFTCAYAVVAALSFHCFFFLNSIGVEHSPFDVVSFLGLPIQFRWHSITSDLLLLLWIALTILGFGFSSRRDFRQGPSPGFFTDTRKGMLATIGSLTGDVKWDGSFGTNRESKTDNTQPLLTFAYKASGNLIFVLRKVPSANSATVRASSNVMAVAAGVSHDVQNDISDSGPDNFSVDNLADQYMSCDKNLIADCVMSIGTCTPLVECEVIFSLDFERKQDIRFIQYTSDAYFSPTGSDLDPYTSDDSSVSVAADPSPIRYKDTQHEVLVTSLHADNSSGELLL